MSKDENAVATIDPGAIMEAVIAKGNLSDLTAEQRAKYYTKTCESMGLNPFTKPFEYIELNKKLTLYATKTAADQLRKINTVSLAVVSEETTADGLRVVRVRATLPDGRTDEEIGAVTVKGLAGEFLANAYMKAITKAKRRATLSICGLGWLDESEVETIPEARRVPVSSYVPDDEPTIDIAEAEYAVDGDGVIVEDDNEAKAPKMNEIEEEYYARLIVAESHDKLDEIGREMTANGVSHPELIAAGDSRRRYLGGKRQQRQLVGAAAGEAGNDKFSG